MKLERQEADEMRYMRTIAPLLLLLICGSSCTSTQAPPPIITPGGSEMNPQSLAAAKAEIGAVRKVKLEVAQYELKLYEEELKATREEIRQAEKKIKGPSPSLLNWENELKDKIIQSKVKIHEIESFPQ